MRLGPVALIWVILIGVLPGCDGNGQARSLPTPQFDGGALFLSTEPAADPAGPPTGGVEARAQALMAGGDVEEPPPRSLQTVPLGASLVSEIPAEFETWTWSRQGAVTVIDYTPVGDSPGALILTRRAPATSPASQMRHFFRDVDGAMGGGLDVAQWRRAASSGEPLGDALSGGGQSIDLEALVHILAGGDSLTGGRGLGYRSDGDSFSGWRWLGENRGEVFLRLASTQGQWGPQPPMPAGLDWGGLASLIEEVSPAGSSPLEAMALESALESGRPSAGVLARTLPRPAQMIVGQLEAPRGGPVQIAVICVTAPHCAVAGEVVEFFDRIRPDQYSPSGRETNFEDHIDQLGLVLTP